MGCSMPGLPVHHQFPKLVQTHVHRVRDAIQPPRPLLSPLLPPSVLPNGCVCTELAAALSSRPPAFTGSQPPGKGLPGPFVLKGAWSKALDMGFYIYIVIFILYDVL